MASFSNCIHRFLGMFDPKSRTIVFIGFFELLPGALLLFACLINFPPDSTVWWHVPAPKGEQSGVGAYLLLVGLTGMLIFHAVGMIRRKAWAIVIAGPPSILLGLWGISRSITRIAGYSGEWDFKYFTDRLVDIYVDCLFFYVFFVSLRIVWDWMTQKRAQINTELPSASST